MNDTTGVILLNMGGPEKLDDVAPFLYNLFSDREIIRLGPSFLQKPIAWFIARRRAPKSINSYAQIGGGSPLIRITGEQGQALQKELDGYGNYMVTTAMRYWQPSAEDALHLLAQKNIRKIIALPLYPHYSCATSGSSISDLKMAMEKGKYTFDLTEIHGWPESPNYIRCMVENIQKGIEQFPGREVEVVYSAHSLPTSFIEAGDPYLEQLKITIEKIDQLTGKTGHLCFQSRSGPVEWLSPSTSEMISRLSDKGYRNILMVPISFVSDHLETLYEINILYKKMAEEKGMTCRPCESLNLNPLFIRALKELVIDHSR